MMRNFEKCETCAWRRSRGHCRECRFDPARHREPTEYVKGKTVFIRAGAQGGYYWTKPDL